MPAKPNETALTPLGTMIHQNGLAIPFVIAKSGINRNRLAYLRTNQSAILSIKEAQALAPVFKMTLDQFAAELNRIEQEGKRSSQQIKSLWVSILLFALLGADH